MHGKRHEHPEVFKARMAFHKGQKTQGKTLDKIPAKPTGDGSTVKNEGTKAESKDAVSDKAQTQKRKATFQRKATDAAKADEKKPHRGVLNHTPSAPVDYHG